MKIFLNAILLLIFLLVQLSVKAQVTADEQKEIDRIISTLPPLKRPQDEALSKLCFKIDKQDIGFHNEIKEIAGVSNTDNYLTVKAKVQRLWNLYYKEFGCDSSGFPIEFGNILKYSVHKSYTLFIDGLVEEYGININPLDPSDGKTLLDFVEEEIKRLSNDLDKKERVKDYKQIYQHLKNDLGAKHSKELN